MPDEFNLIPVDHDPFEDAAARIRSRYPTREASPEAMAASQGNVGFGDVLASKAQSLASLPQRATQAAGELQQTGDAYDPGPALETAGLMAGARFPTVSSGELGAMGGRLGPRPPANNNAVPVERVASDIGQRISENPELSRIASEPTEAAKNPFIKRSLRNLDDRSNKTHADIVSSLPENPTSDDILRAVLKDRASGGRVISPTIIRKYDVPYLAGSSNDGKHVYIDRRVPKRISVKLASGNGRKWVDPAEFLAAHETAEHTAMLKGKPYLQAHTEDADDAERAAVKKHGLSWGHYEKIMDGLLSHIEHEHPKNPPPDLYLKPYPHDKRKLLARLEKEKAA